MAVVTQHQAPIEIITKPQPPAPPPKNNPLGSILSYTLVFVVLLGAIVGAAVAISKWVSVTAGVMTSVIIIGALLAIGVVGATGLRNDDRLSDESFLKLMIEAYRRLPLLKGGDSVEKALEKKEEA